MRARGGSEAHEFTIDGWGLPFTDRDALNEIFSVTYEELRRLAYAVRRSDPNAAVSPTTLVNEAWLKLANSPRLSWASTLHFKRIAARAMRQLLIENARRRNALKRGGGAVGLDELDESLCPLAMPESDYGEEELLRLDHALEELARLNPRQATLVECRFFGGLDVAETAEILGVSEATVMRDWRAARAWLGQGLRNAVS